MEDYTDLNTGNTAVLGTIGVLVTALLREGLTNLEVQTRVKEKFPDSRTTLASVSSHRQRMRRAGEKIPTSATARARRADWNGVTERVTKREHTVGWFVEEAIRAGRTNAEVLELVREKFPLAKTSHASVVWYRSQMRLRITPVEQTKR